MRDESWDVILSAAKNLPSLRPPRKRGGMGWGKMLHCVQHDKSSLIPHPLTGAAMTKQVFLMIAACLFLASAAWAQLSKDEEEYRDCVKCHSKREPNIIKDWQESKHFENNVGCASCHGTDHEYITDNAGRVPPSRCSTCHAKQFSEFIRSRHSIAWARMEQSAQYKDLPEETRTVMCQQCHSVSEKCDSCHTRHKFDRIEARKPAACATCHSGPSQPQFEVFDTSKHGVLYRTEGMTGRAPVCVTCHGSESDHDVSRGLARGPVGDASIYVGLDNKPITEKMAKKRRQDMLRVCGQCHSRGFAVPRLEAADAVHRATDELLDEARSIVESLNKEGLLTPPVSARPAHPNGGKSLVLGLDQQYQGTSRVEGLFFNMAHKSSLTAWKGAYHMNPDYAHTYGWVALNLDFIALKEEARKLREKARTLTKGGG